MNRKKLTHTKTKDGLNMPYSRRHKRPFYTRMPPQAPNQCWSLGRARGTGIDIGHVDMLAVFDDFTRECLLSIADTSLTEARVVHELDLPIARHGRPLSIVCDYGTMFTNIEFQHWAQVAGIELHRHSPYRPMPKSYVERYLAAQVRSIDGAADTTRKGANI